MTWRELSGASLDDVLAWAGDQPWCRAMAVCQQDAGWHSEGDVWNQLTDEHVWWRPTPSQNSIANLILHLCGNIRQWIVSGLGGEPDIRNRPQEFAERGPIPKHELTCRLDDAVRQADAVLAALPPDQLLANRRIQGFDATGLSAIFDSVAHFKGHTQEIICLTRMQLGEAYQFDWIPSTTEQGAK